MRWNAINTLLALAALAVALTAVAAPGDAQDPLPANYYGGGLRWGDVVTAWIGEAECGTATADASGGWQMRVNAGDCGGAAEAGAPVWFTVTPRPNAGPLWTAQQTAVWYAGFVPEDVGGGITLTGSPGALFWRCQDSNTGQWFEECGAEFERRADARYAAADHTHTEPTPGPEPTPEGGATPAAGNDSRSPGAVASDYRYYTVQAGDAVWSIARELAGPGADYEDFANRIADLNDLGPDSTLQIGQVLLIPRQ